MNTPPVYLDYNATTPLHPKVLEAMLPYLLVAVVIKTYFAAVIVATPHIRGLTPNLVPFTLDIPKFCR